MKLIRIFLPVLLLFPSCSLLAQQPVEMADTLRSEGKIYVVVAILLVILVGTLFYLFSIDRKVSRLEKKFPENRP